MALLHSVIILSFSHAVLNQSRTTPNTPKGTSLSTFHLRQLDDTQSALPRLEPRCHTWNGFCDRPNAADPVQT